MDMQIYHQNPYPYFYFILFYFILVLIHNSSKYYSKNLVYMYYTIVLFVMLVIGLRGNYDEYSRIYVLMPTLKDFFSGDDHIVVNHINQKGFIFTFILSIFKTLNFNAQAIFLFFSSTAVFLHAFYFRKYTKYYFLAFLLYLSHEICMKEWIGVRMGFASVLLLPMIYYLRKGEKIKFFFLVLVATLIQYVAILSVFLYFLNYRIKVKYLFYGLVVSILLLQSGIIYNTFMWFDSIGILPNIISSYLDAKNYVYDVGLSHPKTIQQIIVICVLILFFNSKENGKMPEYYNLIFNAYYLGTILMILFSELALFSFRFGAHFTSVEPILLTYIIIAFKNKTTIANIIAFMGLAIAYINYIVIGRIPDYFLFVNYPQ